MLHILVPLQKYIFLKGVKENEERGNNKIRQIFSNMSVDHYRRPVSMFLAFSPQAHSEKITFIKEW